VMTNLKNDHYVVKLLSPNRLKPALPADKNLKSVHFLRNE